MNKYPKYYIDTLARSKVYIKAYKNYYEFKFSDDFIGWEKRYSSFFDKRIRLTKTKEVTEEEFFAELI